LYYSNPTAPPIAGPDVPTSEPQRGLEIIIHRLFNTGVGVDGGLLSVGDEDPHYTIEEIQSSATLMDAEASFWLPNGPNSMWIWRLGALTDNVTSTMVTSFDLTGYDPTTAKCVFDVVFDNFLEVSLNGDVKVQLGGASCEFCGRYTSLEIASGFLPKGKEFKVSSLSDRGDFRCDNIKLYGAKNNIFIS
jgi:hypothetical protein